MTSADFKRRLLAAMAEQGMDRAQLARRSGVGYQTIDKFLRGEKSDTTLDKALKLARAAGISLDSEQSWDELRRLYSLLSDEEREFLTRQVRALASDATDNR